MNQLLDVPTDWHEHFFTAPANLFWERMMPAESAATDMPFILRMLGPTSGHVVLDIGCGTGRHARALASAGRSVIGIDSSPDAIERTNAVLTNNVRFVQADVRDLPELPPCEGAIWMGNGFNYFDDADTVKALQAVHHRLLPGSRLVIQCYSAAESVFPLAATERETGFPGGSYGAQMQYDCLTSRLITQAKLTLDGNVHDLVFAHHIRTTGEMVSQLEEAGFGPVDLFADVNEQPFAPGSQQLLLVATAR